MQGTTLQVISSVGCGQHLHGCTCEEPANHTTPHLCRCGGSWRGTRGEPDFEMVRYPVRSVAPSVLDPDRGVGDGPEIIYLPPPSGFGSLFAPGLLKAFLDESYEDLMETIMQDAPLFKSQYMQEPKVKVSMKTYSVGITVEVDEPDYGRLIEQCKPPLALQSGEVRSNRRDRRLGPGI